MARLENRLRQIEIKLKTQTGNPTSNPGFIDLLDLPKETVIETFSILKDATLGQCMLKLDRNEKGRQTEYIPFDQFTPEQIYDRMEARRYGH